MNYVIEIGKAKNVDQVGSKAKGLWFLQRHGIKIPQTHVCTTKAHQHFNESRNQILSALHKELIGFIDPLAKYSIRSSANLEDSDQYSFAGQFKTFLNISSLHGVINAIVSIWESSQSEQLAKYMDKTKTSDYDLKIAVIIQRMVEARYSGAIFTRNPITGMDEVVIELLPGLGDSLLQRGLTPERWIYKWGNWIEKPLNAQNMPLILELLKTAKFIEKIYGKPIDLEWSFDGEDTYWLQVRSISTIKDVNIYSNKISKEFLPGIIKPLIWSIGIPVVNTSWKRILVEIAGKKVEKIDINSLAKSFYYRAYFNMGVIGDIFELIGMPRDSIEILIGLKGKSPEKPRIRPGIKTLRYIPRLFFFALHKLLFGGQIENFLSNERHIYSEFSNHDINNLNEKQLLNYLEHLLKHNTDSSYFVIISRLLLGFYTLILKNLLVKINVDISTISFSSERKLLQDIDLNHNLALIHEYYKSLPEGIKRAIDSDWYSLVSGKYGSDIYIKPIKEFIDKFGHLSDSGNDFSYPQWKEKPDYVIKLIRDYQQPIVSQQLIDIDKIDANIVRKLFIKFFYKKVLKYRVIREKVDFLYTYGYSLFRSYFLRIAAIFREKGYITEYNDVFFFTYNEISTIIQIGVIPTELKSLYLKRKGEVKQYQNIQLPNIIIGDHLPLAPKYTDVVDRLKGIGTSKGQTEGNVKVIKGMDDFYKMEQGDVKSEGHYSRIWWYVVP
jgi:hypothetical protein